MRIKNLSNVGRLLLMFSIVGLMVAFFVHSASAVDLKWEEKQAARFDQTGLKPGDIIEKEGYKNIEGMIPPRLIEWYKAGDVNIRIGELKYDVAPDQEWVNAGSKNAGKYKLDAKNNFVETATGKHPLWVYGIPFPNIDLKNDPDAGIKFMYNRGLSVRRMGSAKLAFSLEWIGPRGFERIIHAFWAQYYFWARPDGPTRNANKREYMDILAVTEPYDVAGTAQLTWRKLDGAQDELFAYIPAIRRVKKISGGNRSDPWMGSDVCVDDGDGWAGLTHTMKWKIIGERTGLLCLSDQSSESTLKVVTLPDGSWRNPKSEIPLKWGWEVEGTSNTVLWVPQNVVYVPRDFILIEGIPRDPYYNYGRTMYWIDKDTYWINYKMIWDRGGDSWKGLLVIPRCVEFGEGKRGFCGGTSGYVMYDAKTNHATSVICSGTRKGHEYASFWNNPKVNQRMFTVERLRVVSK